MSEFAANFEVYIMLVGLKKIGGIGDVLNRL